MPTGDRTGPPPAHSHRFVEEYDGFVGFGLDRQTDEHSLIYYLQKVGDDALARTLVERMADEEISQLFSLLAGLLRRHLSDGEYHRLFLKESHP
jgi:hypothetical protein